MPSRVEIALRNGISVDEHTQRVGANGSRLRTRIGPAHVCRERHLINAAAAEGVVRMRGEQRLPRSAHRGLLPAAREPGETGPWLCVAHEQPLDLRILALLVRTRGEGALQRPGPTGGIAQLSVHARQRDILCRGEQPSCKSVERIGHDAVWQCSVRQRIDRGRSLALACMVIGAVRQQRHLHRVLAEYIISHAAPAQCRGLCVGGQ